MSISLFIAGDVVPMGVSPKIFSNKGNQIFQDLKPYMAETDFSIVNLEAPVIKGETSPIKKSGPSLSTTISTVEVLKDVGFGVFTLANNHFLDQGQDGVEETIDACNSLSVNVVGGGKTLKQARKPLFLHKGNSIVAIVNVCENEFSIANSEHGGSNPLDLINLQEDIDYARQNANYVVLIIHGGVEWYHYPTPRMKRWYRFFVDIGVDAIINHHQHCINGYEVYKGKPIFYGLGNLFFPGMEGCPESWNYGYAVKLILGDRIDFELIPYKQSEDSISIRNRKEFAEEIKIFNIPIADDYLLQQKFDEFIIDNENYIKTQLLPSFLKGRLMSSLSIRGYMGKMYKGKDVFSIKNRLSCESHYELLKGLFELLVK